MDSKICIAVLVAAVVCLANGAPQGGYKQSANYAAAGVPPLPPFGTAAQHPYYKIALRYESSTRSPYRVDSAYAYQVDGQSVQVSRVDNHKSY